MFVPVKFDCKSWSQLRTRLSLVLYSGTFRPTFDYSDWFENFEGADDIDELL